MGYEYKQSENAPIKSRTLKAKGMMLKLTNISFLHPITSAYFSFASFITKPLYIYYQSKLADVSQITEMNVLEKTRTAGFLRRR